jgi:hypothetical protein
MVDDGFFKKPKTISEVKAELENRGHHIPLTSLSGPMQALSEEGAAAAKARWQDVLLLKLVESNGTGDI